MIIVYIVPFVVKQIRRNENVNYLNLNVSRLFGRCC